LLCRAHELLPLGSTIRAHLSFEVGERKKTLDCDSVVTRAFPVDAQHYELFLEFNPSCLD